MDTPLGSAQKKMNETVALSDIRPVEIGDDVWIGTGAVILKGVRIGPRAVGITRL